MLTNPTSVDALLPQSENQELGVRESESCAEDANEGDSAGRRLELTFWRCWRSRQLMDIDSADQATLHLEPTTRLFSKQARCFHLWR